MYYAGIGSRKTPDNILRLMEMYGKELAKKEYTLRSGGAEGADTAFETGCDTVKHSEKAIYIPWNGFNNRWITESGVKDLHDVDKDWCMDIAAMFHPNWLRCSPGARKLHARNVCQVLGPEPNSRHSEFIVCYTPDGKFSGGTGQALRIAHKYEITIYNLHDPDDIKKLDDYIGKRVSKA